MGFIRTALIGAAVYGVVKYLTEKDAFGRTRLDEIKEKAPQWVDKAKAIKSDLQTGNVPQL